MSNISAWISAFRLKTLPLSVSIIAMGNFLALADGQFNLFVCIFSFLTAILLQILSNIANDYGDAENGADTNERLGPTRQSSSGSLSIQAMKQMAKRFAIAAFLSGVTLLLFAYPTVGFMPIIILLVIGILCIIAAISYTATKIPYGYKALGDLSVFLFFGPVAVAGTYFLHSNTISKSTWVVSCGLGLLSTAVLHINNMRDLQTDKAAGKTTIANLLGLKLAKVYHFLLISIAISLFIFYYILQHKWQSMWGLAPTSLLVFNLLMIMPITENKAFDPWLKQLAVSILVFTLIFGISIQ